MSNRTRTENLSLCKKNNIPVLYVNRVRISLFDMIFSPEVASWVCWSTAKYRYLVALQGLPSTASLGMDSIRDGRVLAY